jgi:hypothetical protein
MAGLREMMKNLGRQYSNQIPPKWKSHFTAVLILIWNGKHQGLKFDILIAVKMLMLVFWRWRQYVPLKGWYLPTSPHGITTKKPNIIIKVVFIELLDFSIKKDQFDLQDWCESLMIFM